MPENCCFTTAKTSDREPAFLQPAAAGIVMRSIDWMESRGRWKWLCYVVMPDHLHLVFTLKSPDPLGDLMRSFKGFTGNRIDVTLKRHGVVWPDAYFDHRIREQGKLEQVAFYCFRNPVIAGLVLEGEDWPFFRCKPDLWSAMMSAYDDLLQLELERKLWMPPSARGFEE